MDVMQRPRPGEFQDDEVGNSARNYFNRHFENYDFDYSHRMGDFAPIQGKTNTHMLTAEDVAERMQTAKAAAKDEVPDWVDELMNAVRPGDDAQADMEAIWDRQLAANQQHVKEQKDLAKWQHKQNAKEAHIARQWSQMMRNTQYQDTVKDLQLAGLNPILAISKGFGSSAPSAAQASSGMPTSSQMPVDTKNQYYDAQKLKIAQTELTLAKIQLAINGASALGNILTQLLKPAPVYNNTYNFSAPKTTK